MHKTHLLLVLNIHINIFMGFTKTTIKTFGVGHSPVQDLAVARTYVFPWLGDVRETKALLGCLELIYCGETDNKADVPRWLALLTV